MTYQTNPEISHSYDSGYRQTYEGKQIKVITVFSDIGVAIVEDEYGNIFDVKNSVIRTVNSQ
ncbi:hypothetical protein [Candidatus Sulfurimonas baltica]|uniref:Uncharacterized protein n=1 Tax=Candidatus Sulfurimonas baltica TaxID=2740404 RepID=A0A7S7RLD9_9BACT|nr:hypothetical protein [Candidatus Sulfurimonas baltica]QOY51042.1 hypothetical protein HUE88_07780 [Candidatus Sulfurimonas baltica]